MNNLSKQINLIVVGTLVSSIAIAFSHVNRANAVNLTVGSPYTENFDSLGITADDQTSSVLPAGWNFTETGTNTNGLYQGDDGGDNGGDTYAYGNDGSTGGANPSERAFGGLRSGTLVPLFGVNFQITNATNPVTAINISYRGEQWRDGNASVDRLDFQYSLNGTATSLTDGTWTDFDALDFSSPNTSGSGRLDGNTNSTNRTATFAPIGLNLTNGQTIRFRWVDVDASGADDGLAVDNFQAEAIPEPLTIIGSATALLFGGTLKRKFNFKKKLSAKQS